MNGERYDRAAVDVYSVIFLWNSRSAGAAGGRPRCRVLLGDDLVLLFVIMALSGYPPGSRNRRMCLGRRQPRCGAQVLDQRAQRTYDATGGTMCSVNRTVSELKIVEAVTGELMRLLRHPDLVEEMVGSMVKRLRERQADRGATAFELERRVRSIRSRIENTTEAIAGVW